jgi:hypothetical protein
MSSLFNYEFISSKLSMIVDISKEICGEYKDKMVDSKENIINVENLFRKIFGSIVIRCFFGNIRLEPINDKNVFEFLSDLVDKIGKRD